MVEIKRIDPQDEERFRVWYDAFSAGEIEGRVDPNQWAFPAALVAYRRNDPNHLRVALGAFVGDTCVGGAGLRLPLAENRTLANFGIAVHPDHRRQGVGTALLATLVDLARAEGREKFLVGVDVPVDADESWPGRLFAAKHGFTLANTEVRRQQPLPVPTEKLDALAAKAAERTSGYRLVSWVGPCPDEYAVQYANLKALLTTEAPTGELEFEVETWDVERLRDDEQRAVEEGRTVYTTIAVAPDGTVAAHTQAAVSKHEQTRASQWDTLVLTEHRGHRLGMAVKVANVRALQEGHPNVNRMDTWNAEQNGPMVAVNEELGYQVMEFGQEWQRAV